MEPVRGNVNTLLNKLLETTVQQKALLDRIVAMLTKFGQRGCAVREELCEYRGSQFDTDTDTDTDDHGSLV
jgi:hypothetical protein